MIKFFFTVPSLFDYYKLADFDLVIGFVFDAKQIHAGSDDLVVFGQ
jgi:hypothetical protein